MLKSRTASKPWPQSAVRRSPSRKVTRFSKPCLATSSRPTAQAYVAASVFDRVRLQVGLAAIFPVRTHEETSWSLLPTGGLQFLWP